MPGRSHPARTTNRGAPIAETRTHGNLKKSIAHAGTTNHRRAYSTPCFRTNAAFLVWKVQKTKKGSTLPLSLRCRRPSPSAYAHVDAAGHHGRHEASQKEPCQQQRFHQHSCPVEVVRDLNSTFRGKGVGMRSCVNTAAIQEAAFGFRRP